MHKIKTLILFAAVVSVGILSSCGGDGGDDPKSDQELTLEALEGTWNLDAASSQFGNGLDGDAVASVTISSTGFTLGGDIAGYVDSGSFTVAEDGTLSSPSVNITSQELALDGDVSISLNSAKTQITVSFETVPSEGRVSGTGSFVLVFVKAS